MAEYVIKDLSDDDAKVFANAMDVVLESALALAKDTRSILSSARDQVRNQIPVELPERVGAVVQSNDGQYFLRWSYDAHTTQPWIAAVDLDNPIRSEDLPLITKVHFMGVDL